jgi:hypothetical protein
LTTGSASLAAGGSQPGFAAFSLDADPRCTDFNDVHAEVMRALYGAEIALGNLIEDHLTVSVDRQTALANLRRALAGESVVVSAFSGDGEARRYFDVAHAPVRDVAGAVTGVTVRATTRASGSSAPWPTLHLRLGVVARARRHAALRLALERAGHRLSRRRVHRRPRPAAAHHASR